jgi:hypothetical protein
MFDQGNTKQPLVQGTGNLDQLLFTPKKEREFVKDKLFGQGSNRQAALALCKENRAARAQAATKKH